MPLIKVPAIVGSITTTVTGAQSPSSGVITVTVAEANNLMSNDQWGPGTHPIVTTHATTGAATLFMPSMVTSITINGNVYAVSGGKITGVPAADVTQFISTVTQERCPFRLVVG